MATTTGAPAEDAIYTARIMAEIACEVYTKYGMPLNFQKGKAEAWIQWIGEYSMTVKRDNLTDTKVDDQGTFLINCNPKLGPDASFALRVVKDYKHLGAHLWVIDKANSDLCHRLSIITVNNTSIAMHQRPPLIFENNILFLSQ